MSRLLPLVIAGLTLATAPALAEVTDYRAMLNGASIINRSGSTATAKAEVAVDRAAQTVAITMTVTGIPVDALWDRLVAAPAGPIHLHRYGGSDLSDPNSSTLAFPVPFGPGFQPTTEGFTVTTGAVPYAQGATTLGLTTSFEDFVAAMDAGVIVLNIHTDAHNGGEISGQVIRNGQSAPPVGYAEPIEHSGHK
jgi:CHRD domain